MIESNKALWAIDIGGTTTRIGVVDHGGEILATRRIPTPTNGSPGEFSKMVASAAAGLRVVAQRSATNGAWYHFQWMHLIALRPAGERSPYWSRDTPFRAGERCLRVAAAIAHRLGCNYLLGRLLDLSGCGDNQVMILQAADAGG